jgi:hypothetical protein
MTPVIRTREVDTVSVGRLAVCRGRVVFPPLSVRVAARTLALVLDLP